MIKFFRKIRQNLLLENKTGKYFKYAIGEIVLVVIGILIALQINNWNQNRINNLEEQRIFQDLGEELQFNRFLMKNGTEKMQEVIASAERMLDWVNTSPEEFNQSLFDQDLDKLTWVWLAGRPTTLYDVLSASGDFDLITSSNLRKKLADFKRGQETLIAFEYNQNRFVDNQLRPFLNKNVDRTTVRSIYKSSQLITTEHDSPFISNHIELLQNREFANLLTDLIFFTKRIEENYSRLKHDIIEIDSLMHVKYPSMETKTYIPY
ncbi:DUF6090 family protein [Croceitalea sp. P059]|uniref:DUF6090 family protein n=1 Tax=Croceitalea sp. P059 TaxID=3075601 RepID=UPI002885D8AE|nr:DUF6090 family protein [Croceitalea sp. P059]MDT0538706.1 DUF6090 family protein [Croceitalea sp. P059]